MKHPLLRWAALFAALCLLTGCAGREAAPAEAAPAKAPAASEPAAAQPSAPEGFALPYVPDAGFNPYNCTALANRTALSLLYEPLFAVTQDFVATPYLCESYTPSEDGRTHSLTLRQGVTFSDGSALTAADAAASILAAKGSGYYGQRLRHITSVTAASDTGLTITTDAACGSLDLLLNIPVVKAATVQDGTPVGTGPYMAGSGAFTRTAWWRGETPPVAAGTIALVASGTPAELRDSFEYGQVNLVCTDPNSGTRVAYHSDYELWNNNTTMMQYIGFNLNSPVFVYSSLRAAVTYAIDRAAIVTKTAGGFASPAVLPASPNAAIYNQKLADNYAYNPAAFQAALDASEIRDMNSDGVLDVYSDQGAQPLAGTMIVSSASEQRVSAAQTVVDALNQLGFSLTLKTLDSTEYTAALRNGTFDLYYGEVRLSPDFDLSPFFSAGGSLSYGGIADGALELLCTQALENLGNSYNLHQKVMERGLLCPVLFKTYAVYSTRGRVSNLTPCLDGVFTIPIA